MGIRIVNMRFEKPEGMVKVDRSSVLGNQFRMKDETERDKVCHEYSVWILGQIAKNNVAVVREIERLYEKYIDEGELILGCWCVPKRCHADSIKQIIENWEGERL